MAQGKKSFIAYADWKNIFDELPNEDAGALIKHIFSYVNDEDPQTDSVLIKAVFANIKSTLKRDLNKWETQLDQRKKAGLASAEARKLARNQSSTVVESRERNPTVNDNDNDNDNDNVTVNVNDIDIKETITEKSKRFIPPSLQEVEDYCFERINGLSAQHFIDHYTSNGWMVGKNKMKDWKSAVRNWERMKKQFNNDKNGKSANDGSELVAWVNGN